MAQGAVPSGGRSSRAARKPAETSHPVLQLSISYLSFEQPAGGKSSLCAGQVLGLALLPARASGAAASSCLLAAQAGLRNAIPIQPWCSPWSGSHHTCVFQIFFKIRIIPRAAAASPFSKSEAVRSPAYKNPSVLPSGGSMQLKSSEQKHPSTHLDPSGVTREKVSAWPWDVQQGAEVCTASRNVSVVM